jgi:Flp pilus assembly protein TadG
MNHTRKFLKRTEGAAAIIIACSLFALIGVASLAIDMGQLYTARNQMQNMVDAAALAGVGQLIQNVGGTAVWRTDLAQAAALKVSHDQAVQDHLGDVADGDRNDMTITFGTWNINAGDPTIAWTPNTANPNAMQVVIRRSGETVFGPVTSLFAKALGHPSTNVSASAIAFLGYTSEVPTSGIELPLALPATGASSPLACNGHPGWFARLIGPTEALAAVSKTIKFRDTGGSTVLNNVPTSPYAPLDANQPYFFTPQPNPSINSVPNTVKNIIAKNYTPTLQGTTSVPVYVGDIKIGDQIYPASEYCWGSNYLRPIFDNLKTAYNAKKDANGNWQTTVVVHGPVSTSSLFNKTGFMSLARLLNPFSAPEAIACATIQPPTTYVKTFANVTITGVTSGTGNDGNYTYPKTMRDSYTNYQSITYNNKKDFLDRYPNSSWNVNTATIDVAANTNTVSPPGTLSGGPSNGGVNPGGSTSVGAFATVPRLVK